MWFQNCFRIAALVLASCVSARGGVREFYRSSFEGVDGGWTRDATWHPVGDWERGIPNPSPAPLPGCSINAPGPRFAFHGAQCWGTRLNQCYTNANGTSFLRQTFDFTTVVNGSLSWREFRHIVATLGNDRGTLKINGDSVYQVPFTNLVSNGWELQTVDLTPYSGLPSVEIVFEFFATASINAPGWYIDDVIITSLVDPNPGDVGVLLADDPDPVTRIGDPVVYTATVINHGDVSAANVLVTGGLDPALVFNAALSDPAVVHDGSPLGGAFSISVGNMPRFSVRRFDLAGNTTQLGPVTATVAVDADGLDPNPANDGAAETTQVALTADVAVALQSDQNPVIVNTPFQYRVEIANLGPSDSSSIEWDLTLPTGVTFLSSSAGAHDGALIGGRVFGKLPALLAGATQVVTVNVTPNPGDLSDLLASTSVAGASPDETDPDPSNNDAGLTIRQVASADPFPRAIFTTGGIEVFVVGQPLPAAHPPGLPDRSFSFFGRPYASPDGRTWGIHAQLGSLVPVNNEVVVLVTDGTAETVLYENVTPLPDVPGETLGNALGKLSINDHGCYALAVDSSTNRDLIVKGCGSNVAGSGTLAVVARVDNVIPGDPQSRQYIFPLREAQIDNHGVVRFMARRLLTSTILTRIFQTPDDGLTINTLFETTVNAPLLPGGGLTDPWENWDTEFSTARAGMYVTGDGLHMLLRGDTTGTAATDDILALDNTIVLQEGTVAHASFAEAVSEPAFGIYLAPNGDWYARGRNLGNQEWVMRNGEVVARGGAPIFPGSLETWNFGSPGISPFFNVVAGDAIGNYVIGGKTDVSPDGVLVFYPGLTTAGADGGPRVIARVGDPVDLDGNGLFDHAPTITGFSNDGVVILIDGTVVALLSVGIPFDLPNVAGTTTSSDPVIAAMKVVNLRGACCLPDGTCVPDVFELDCLHSMGGRPFPGQSCSQVPCGFGACCVVDFGSVAGDPTGAHCEELSAEQCLADPLNEFKGHGTRCQDVTCGGACCTQAPGPSVAGGEPDPCFHAFTRPNCETAPYFGDYQGDGTVCTGVLCDPCTSDADCDDSDPCNGAERCVSSGVAGGGGGYCVNGVPPEISDGVECTTDTCGPTTGDISHTPNHAACDDGDPCNGAEQCDPAQGCVPGAPPSCDDGISCTNDSCDKDHPAAHPQTGCVNVPNDEKCDDGVDCTDDTCDVAVGRCVFTSNDLRCLDENRCTENERCDVNLGCLSDPVNCDDFVACTIDTCDPVVGCLNGAEHTRCDDGNACTTDLCRPLDPKRDANGCIHAPRDCDDGDNCTNDSCDPKTGECLNQEKACDDGIRCTEDTCDPDTGECVHRRIPGCCDTDADCEDGNDCTIHVCDPHVGCVLTEYRCGACCQPDPFLLIDCLDVLPAQCSGGDFRGVGTRCQGLNPPCSGACCVGGQGCRQATREACNVLPSAQFFGNGSTCETAPCGACCVLDLGCIDGVIAKDCTDPSDRFFQGQSCAAIPCGACCNQAGECIDGALEEECVGVGNDFRGPGSTCSGLVDGDCGAACVRDSDCRTTPPDACHGPERCVDGRCLPGDQIDCDDADDCTDDSCDPATGCRNQRIEGCCETDADCDDGDPCTVETCDPHLGCVVTGFLCGACCRVGEPCIDDVTIEQCSSAFDTFLGVGSSCLTAPCGACCDTDSGACTDGVTESECEAADRAFQGPATTCQLDPCEGACCLADGSCLVTSGDQCLGIFRGVGTACDELNPPCRPFIGGACCLADGTCVDGTTAETCAGVLSGRYQGDETRCDDIDCTANGACCLPDGTCVQSTAAGCPDGTFQGAGTTCPDSCQGACCLPDGSCAVGSAQDCPGDYRGDGTNCAELNPPCEPFAVGACCLQDDSCVDGTTAENCANVLFGRYLGDDTRCDDVNCDTIGACCLEDGSCVQATEAGCAAMGTSTGTATLFLGVGVACVGEDGDECPFPCNSDQDCDDGLFCNGAEPCHLFFCVPGIAPCRRSDQVCDEAADRCISICANAAGADCVELGDSEADADVDLRDAGNIFNVFGEQVGPGHPAEVMDFNRDGVIDLEDYRFFARRMNGAG